MSLSVDINFSDRRWKEVAKKNVILGIIKNTLNYDNLLDIKYNNIDISILLTNAEQMRHLNKNFRNKDYPTNVLSFPCGGDESSKFNTNILYIGDMAFGYDVILQESLDENKTFINHFTHLIVHGVLHLLGYDHESTNDAMQMQATEVNILHQLGIKNPYLI